MEQRFSPLDQINETNIGRLNLAWSLDLPGEAALEATPLEVHGVLYFSGSFAAVYAVDARLGTQLWKYDPGENRADPRGTRRIYGVNRGVAYWNGKVYVCTKDGRMIALDAHTGKPAWSTRFLVEGSNAASTGAPRAAKGRVFIGSSGAETNARGYVAAFDAETGRLLWRFFTVPGDPAKGFENSALAKAAKTWSGKWWEYGGGGTPWNALTIDDELDQIYIGTGNGGPWAAKFRAEGTQDNLFVASIVAIDAGTGKYRWHYQTTPGDVWDYDATQDIVLADLSLDGARQKVLLQANKNGFFYVVNRVSGKLISADKFGKVTWADHIDLKSGRPVEVPGSRYVSGPFVVYPSVVGAHNWQAMSYDPKTHLAYFNYMQQGNLLRASPEAESLVQANKDRGLTDLGIDFLWDKDKDPMDGKGFLLAWDPVHQKASWRVELPSTYNGGALSTAGNLVFLGTATGLLNAYAADSGKPLWSFDAKLGIMAPPISFAIDGKQYVSVLVGYGGGAGEGGPGFAQGWKYAKQMRRLLTFAIDATEELPPTPARDFHVAALDEPSLRIDKALADKGALLYGETCTFCHGESMISTGGAPDLRESKVAFDRASFAALLRSGALLDRGMPKFDDLSDADIEGLYQYIRSKARAAMSGEH
jgi:quinohemoprotein ethanol dehydrogenase